MKDFKTAEVDEEIIAEPVAPEKSSTEETPEEDSNLSVNESGDLTAEKQE